MRYWSQPRRREQQATKFVPVHVQAMTPSAAIEVRGPAGWSIRVDAGADPAWLATLLSGLR